MNIKYLSDIRNFIGKLMDPVERNKTFYPLTLSPVEIANVIDKLQGIYDSPTDTPHDGNTVSIESSINLIDMLDDSETTITVVLPGDSDPSQGKISVLSPLGSALLGKKHGETITFFVGNRMNRFQILAVA